MSTTLPPRVRRENVENLRTSTPATIALLIAGLVRQHVERIEPACVADLYALAELGLPGSVGIELKMWSAKATREILDLPEGTVRETFAAEIGALPPASVPRALRDALGALAERSIPESAALIAQVLETLAAEEPAVVVLPQPRAPRSTVTSHATQRATTAEAAAARRTVAAAPPRTSAPRTPTRDKDVARMEWIRSDLVRRLNMPDYSDRGLKEVVLLAGVRQRSPYSDLTNEEIKAELRRLVRDGKVKNTADRWIAK